MFGIDINELIRTIGLVGVATMVFAESGLLVGFFLPGDTLLFSAGFLTTKDLLGANIHIVIVCLILAAIAGQSAGYWFGRRVGHRIFRRPDSLLFHPDNLVKAELF